MPGKPSILLFGGTFDPIHHGHLIVSLAVAEQLKVDRVELIPAGVPPHKPDSPVTSAEHRLRMTQLAVNGDLLFDVSDCEVKRPGPSYTLDTVRRYRKTYGPDAALYWLIGADSLPELPTWHKPSEIAAECILVTAAREGTDPGDLAYLADTFTPEQIDSIRRHILPTPRVDMSSTEIRRRVAAGRPIRYFVPRPVQKYIEENNLYR